jgi:hypothetical protein
MRLLFFQSLQAADDDDENAPAKVSKYKIEGEIVLTSSVFANPEMIDSTMLSVNNFLRSSGAPLGRSPHTAAVQAAIAKLVHMGTGGVVVRSPPEFEFSASPATVQGAIVAAEVQAPIEAAAIEAADALAAAAPLSSSPTHMPTLQPCEDGSHGCDPVSTIAVAVGSMCLCECLEGFLTDPSDTKTCLATQSPTPAPVTSGEGSGDPGGNGERQLLSAAVAVGNDASGTSTHYAYEWTKAHNVKRCLHGLGKERYLKWNQAAVEGPEGAKAWADRGVYAHNFGVYNLTDPAGPAGENIASYVKEGDVSPTVVVANWYKEGNYCDMSVGCRPNWLDGKWASSPEDGSWAAENAQHADGDYVPSTRFTAMLWKDTSELACAFNDQARAPWDVNSTMTSVFIVCRYLKEPPNVGDVDTYLEQVPTPLPLHCAAPLVAPCSLISRHLSPLPRTNYPNPTSCSAHSDPHFLTLTSFALLPSLSSLPGACLESGGHEQFDGSHPGMRSNGE